MLHLDATISALVYTVIWEYCPRTYYPRYFPNNRVVAFVKEQIQRMPDFARFGLAAMTLCLDASTILVMGKPFHALEHQSRLKIIAAWKAAPYSVFFDAIRFYELFSIFGWYAEKERKSSVVRRGGSGGSDGGVAGADLIGPHAERSVYTAEEARDEADGAFKEMRKSSVVRRGGSGGSDGGVAGADLIGPHAERSVYTAEEARDLIHAKP